MSVHSTHCCKTHGCKYGDENCSVVLGNEEQEYPCEDCNNGTEEYFNTTYVSRLKRAITYLKEMAENHSLQEISNARLSGKSEGVSLALSYFEEMLRTK